jgi:thiamine biosynthesis lipoprotein
MGSDFELIVCAASEREGQALLDTGIAEIKRLEILLTEFSDTSATGMINAGAGIRPVAVPAEVYQLIGRCLHLSSMTQGAFDITAGTLKALYPFKDPSSPLPDPCTVEEALAKCGYQHIVMGPKQEVMLRRHGCRIGFGAIGKGYAADCVKKIWQRMGVASGVVNASGDLTAWGLQPDGQPWKVGIADPDKPGSVLLWLPVDNASIATSGNYEQYFDREGTRYSHNIDPRTGRPARWLRSVTIVSPSAELSDALATAVTIMGIAVGLDLINQLPQVHALIIDEHNQVHTSKKIKAYA